jgi:multicomponent Na+:H+ antiporter subunit B
MTSLILRAATRFMLPLLLLFSVFLLLRGHHQPGGGFSGGLVGAAAFALYALAFNVRTAREALWVDPRTFLGSGLILALLSGTASLLLGQPLLTHGSFWLKLAVPGMGTFELGTPLFFDLGVYLVVLGVTLTIILPLAEE